MTPKDCLALPHCESLRFSALLDLFLSRAAGINGDDRTEGPRTNELSYFILVFKVKSVCLFGPHYALYKIQSEMLQIPLCVLAGVQAFVLDIRKDDANC